MPEAPPVTRAIAFWKGLMVGGGVYIERRPYSFATAALYRAASSGLSHLS